MGVFKPCPGWQTCAHEARNIAAFHSWTKALSFARGRARGQRSRHTVNFDGRHWVVEKEGGGL